MLALCWNNVTIMSGNMHNSLKHSTLEVGLGTVTTCILPATVAHWLWNYAAEHEGVGANLSHGGIF